jgi:hypothetical protein
LKVERLKEPCGDACDAAILKPEVTYRGAIRITKQSNQKTASEVPVTKDDSQSMKVDEILASLLEYSKGPHITGQGTALKANSRELIEYGRWW